jgi:membrane protease YdiL (CAAX protease family)
MMSSLSSVVKRHPLITFFVLAYAISWGFLPIEAVRFMPAGPLIAALIVALLTRGWAGLRELGSRMIRWRVRWYWYVVAIGLPLAVVMLTAGLNVALGASAPSLAQFGSVTTILMVFAVRLVNPADGALGEEPGWRGFALPGLQSTLSPLVSTLILGVLVSGWHVPILFLEEGGLQPSYLGGFLLGTVGVTFWYSWLFNHTGGSVLITLIAHATQGTITIGGFWSAGADLAQANLLMGVVASAVAIGLVVFDRKAWRAPTPARATTVPSVPPRRPTPAAPA